MVLANDIHHGSYILVWSGYEDFWQGITWQEVVVRAAWPGLAAR